VVFGAYDSYPKTDDLKTVGLLFWIDDSFLKMTPKRIPVFLDFLGVSIDPTAPFKMNEVGFRAFKSPPI